MLCCKENCRYEMGVQKIVFRGHNYYIPYFTHKSQINGDLLSWAKWAGSDVTARPHMISFSNGCALIPQPKALGNVSRVIVHYFDMN